jgi:hypothetical protein
MPLKTDTFGITRTWLSAALTELPKKPDIFAKANLSIARKTFLAGKNQLDAIKNWLSRAEIVGTTGRSVELTELGKLMSAQDLRAERAWTWWLFHLHLCASQDAFPYSAFFIHFDADGQQWRTLDETVDALCKKGPEGSDSVERATVENYFEGVDQAFRPGRPLYSLGLIERREGDDGDGKKKMRRSLVQPSDLVVAYATTLFQKSFFEIPTVELRLLLEKGLARAIGIRDIDLREALTRISQHASLSQFLQYHRTVNLDSVHFLRSGDGALRAIRNQVYMTQDVKWP